MKNEKYYYNGESYHTDYTMHDLKMEKIKNG